MLPSGPERPETRQGEPSPWIARWADAIPDGGEVLDLAAGGGRHSRYLLERGHPVVAVDVDTSRLTDLDAEVVQADLEHEPWPFVGRRFAGIVVTNYLWRPLFLTLAGSLTPGGALLYETFNGTDGPETRAFHLRPGELLDAFGGMLRILAYEDTDRQRLVARRDR